MHYLCLIYVLRSSNYLSNVPSQVKTWKLSAVTHGARREHISGQEVTGDLRAMSQDTCHPDCVAGSDAPQLPGHFSSVQLKIVFFLLEFCLHAKVHHSI